MRPSTLWEILVDSRELQFGCAAFGANVGIAQCLLFTGGPLWAVVVTGLAAICLVPLISRANSIAKERHSARIAARMAKWLKD